jgi:hypothetical protein
MGLRNSLAARNIVLLGRRHSGSANGRLMFTDQELLARGGR